MLGAGGDVVVVLLRLVCLRSPRTRFCVSKRETSETLAWMENLSGKQGRFDTLRKEMAISTRACNPADRFFVTHISNSLPIDIRMLAYWTRTTRSSTSLRCLCRKLVAHPWITLNIATMCVTPCAECAIGWTDPPRTRCDEGLQNKNMGSSLV